MASPSRNSCCESEPESPVYPLLLRQRLSFKPVSPGKVDVFFDQVNGEIFVVQSQSNGSKALSFIDSCGVELEMMTLDSANAVLSVKQSPLHNLIAIQVTHQVIQIRSLENNIPGREWELKLSGSKSGKLLGFAWVSERHMLLIANTALELHEVSDEKKTTKLIKAHSLSLINWYILHPQSWMIVVSTSQLGNLLEVYQFSAKGSVLVRLCKFQVENHIPNSMHGGGMGSVTSSTLSTLSDALLGSRRVTFHPSTAAAAATSSSSGSASSMSSSKEILFDRDVALVSVYGKMRLLILKSEMNESSGSLRNSVIVYTFAREAAPKMTHTLLLERLTGRFAFNCVDDLLIVHHQSSQTSLIFDLHFDSLHNPRDRTVLPVLPPYPIKPVKISSKTSSNQVGSNNSNKNMTYDLYPSHWVIFQPNVIIDPHLGQLWHLDIDLKSVLAMMNKLDLGTLQFLIQRRNSKLVICRYVKSLLLEEQNNLPFISQVFNKLNSVLTLYDEEERSPAHSARGTTSSASTRALKSTGVVKGRRGKLEVIDQAAMESYVFSAALNPNQSHRQSTSSGSSSGNGTLCSASEPLADSTQEFIIFALIEYIRSLINHTLPVEHSIYELLINLLVRTQQFYLLNQLTAYKVLSDSKPLACLLLSLESVYPSAVQLAMDMLKRLAVANEEIVEVLLSQRKVLKALRFLETNSSAQHYHGSETASARQFLEVALAAGDLEAFQCVYTFFQLRNLTLRGSPDFVPGERCEKYVERYEQLFSDTPTAATPLVTNHNG